MLSCKFNCIGQVHGLELVKFGTCDVLGTAAFSWAFSLSLSRTQLAVPLAGNGSKPYRLAANPTDWPQALLTGPKVLLTGPKPYLLGPKVLVTGPKPY